MDHDQARRELERTCGFVAVEGRIEVRRIDLIEVVEEVRRELQRRRAAAWPPGRRDGRRAA